MHGVLGCRIKFDLMDGVFLGFLICLVYLVVYFKNY